MITLAIIGGLVCLALLIYVGCHITETHCLLIGLVIMATTPLICWASYGISTTNIPDGYTRVETYSYVTEDGATETLEGPYFKKGDSYYKQELGKATWIPCVQCDYVEVDLPGNADDGENNPFCTSCGNELNAEDKFCAGCGSTIKDRE